MSVAIDYSSGAFAATKAQSVGTITGSDVDLSSGQYFEYTPAADTTFTFSNAPASGTAAGFALAVTGAEAASGYDLANASYDGVSFSIAGQSTLPIDLYFKPDGSSFFALDLGSDTLYSYSLSTPWDVSTASYDSVSFLVSSQSTAPRGVSFKPDGTKMFIVDTDGNIYQYSLSTAWDISTASYDSVSFSIPSPLTVGSGLTFNPDGSKMFIPCRGTDYVYEYNLGTSYDMSTASYNLVRLNVIAVDNTPEGVFFKPSGDKMFLVGFGGDAVYQYSLTSAFDLSTASYDSVSFSVFSQEYSPTGLSFKSDGSKMYVVGTINKTIYQYSTAGSSAPATFTYPTSVDWAGGTAPDAPAVGETDVLVFYTEDGGTTYYGFQAGDAMT